MKHRLTKTQRFVLERMRDTEGPMVLASGSRGTKIGYFPALKEEGIATSATVLDSLVHHGYIVRETSQPPRYRLTVKGAASIRPLRLPPQDDHGNTR